MNLLPDCEIAGFTRYLAQQLRTWPVTRMCDITEIEIEDLHGSIRAEGNGVGEHSPDGGVGAGRLVR
jgi:hypothetical protein